MKNFIAPGKSVTRTAPTGGVLSGKPYLIGALLVVAAIDAAQTEKFTGETTGIFELEKVTGNAWTEGQKLFWDNSAKKVTGSSASGLFPIGTADAAAASADTTGLVRLDGVSVTAVP